MSRRTNLYIGSSGQLAVTAEFLARGYNTAIPQVDAGDDIFVVRDDNGTLWRIQVKTANAKAQKSGYAATFNLGYAQLATPQYPDLEFVFAVRHANRWSDFVLVPRATLYDLHMNQSVGTRGGQSVVLRLGMSSRGVTCNGIDLSTHRADWSRWPPIAH